MPLQINNDIEPPFPDHPEERPNPAPPMSPIEDNDFIDRWIVLHQGKHGASTAHDSFTSGNPFRIRLASGNARVISPMDPCSTISMRFG
jgi:hypothetical protein